MQVEGGVAMKSRLAIILVLLLVATAAVALLGAASSDPLAPYRAADGSLHIPGNALTPQLQRLLFGGNDLQAFYNLTYYAPTPSQYATARFTDRSYLVPNPNVFVRPSHPPVSLAEGIARVVQAWFPPVDWGMQLHAAAAGFFSLFTWDARAAASVDSTTVADVTTAANTCSTTQTTGATDNAVVVLLSERGITSFLTVTYGSVSLTLLANTAANGGTLVRTEVWGFAGALPAGSQVMTATLSGGGTAKMTCATVLLQGVKSVGSFINGTTATANAANASIPLLSAVGVSNLALAVAALQNGGGGVQPTAVTGSGATATDLYGVAVGHCTGGGASNECAAGASLPNPGTTVTWTNPSTQWVVSAIEVVATPTCSSVGGGNCYRIGNNGTWANGNLWSNSPGGAACGCTPLATDFVFFNATPTGTTSLAANTTVAGIDMTGFTGTLDTTASSWSLTVNGNLTIQGSINARGSAILVTGNVTVIGAGTTATLGTSVWTVNGAWTNGSTSAAWSAGTGSVTIKDAASATLTFAALGGSTNEFNNLTLDASVAAGLTYTMATNALRMGGTLIIQNSAVGATGSVVLDTSAANLGLTAGALMIGALGAANTEASTVSVNGSVTISTAAGYIANTGGSWAVTGAWSDASTSASWAFAASIAFRSTVNRTMTFGPQAGNEFLGTVTFDTTVTTAVTYTMATNPLDAAATVTIQNSAVGATGAVALDTSAGSLALNATGLTLSTLGVLNSRASTVTISGPVTEGAANGYVTNSGGTWTVTGGWTNRTTSASWSFAAAMTFRRAAAQSMLFTGSNIAGNEFAGAVTFDTTAAAGIAYTMAAGTSGDSSLKVGGTLTVRNTTGGATAATILDTSAGNYNVTASGLTLGNPRGALRSEGSTITINGAVNVADGNSYLNLGSALWTVTGSWTDGSTSASWNAGTGTVTFRSAGNQTMTFASLGANEVNNAVFDTTTAAGVVYTMSTNGLRAAGTLTVQNTAPTPTGNVVLTTGANLALTTGGVVLGARGTLSANASTVTVNGSWTSTAAAHAWNAGTSTVVFGASGTLTTSAGDSFNNVTQSAGTTTLGSAVTIAGATVVNGTLDSSASNFTLTMQSTLAIGAAGVVNLEASIASTSGNVTIAAGGGVRFAGAAVWTINGSWTDNNATAPASWAVGTSTVRFVAAGATTLTFWTAPASSEFYNFVLDSSVAAGFTYTQVNPLQTAGLLTIQNTAAGASGSVTLDASAANYAATLGSLSLGALGAYNSRAATITANGNVAIATSAYLTNTAAGAWSVAGSWTNNTTSGSWSFAAGVTFRSAANQVMTFKASGTEFGGAVTFDTTNAAGATYTLSTNPLTLAGLLTVRNSTAVPTGNTSLDTSAANLAITAGSVTLGTNGTLVAEGSTLSVAGNWTATAANATFVPGTSTVVFTAAATITMTQAFNNLTVSAGTATAASNLTANLTLTVSGGILAKSTFTLAVAALTLSGGALTSTSGNATVTGNVNISSAASYIAFGTETWTVGGSWTNASTSAAWSVGTATVVFNAAAGQTVSLMPGSSNEFYNVTFNSGATTVTFTMAANGLRVANALTVQGGAGTTTLSTSASNLPITAVTLSVLAGGALAANGSTITLRSMDTSAGSFTPGSSTVVVGTSGGTINVPQTVNNLTVNSGIATTFSGSLAFAGTLTLTSATPTFSGNLTSTGAATITFASATLSIAGSWNTASATGFTSTSSTVTFTGAGKTITLAAGQGFASLSISGTLSQQSQLTASSLTITAGSLAKGTNPLTVNGSLTLSGGALTSTAGSGTVTGNVNISAAASYVAFGSEAWTIGGSWTNASTSASWNAGTGTVTFNSAGNQTMTFAGSNLGGAEFNVVVLDTPTAGGVTYTLATRGLIVAGNLTIQNSASGASGPTTLTTSVAGLPITATGTLTVAANGALNANASTITFGSFDSSAGAFSSGTSTLVASVTGGTIDTPQTLNNLAVNAGVTLGALSSLTVNGILTVNGVLATATFGLAASALAALSGGITGTSGTKALSGNITINPSGYFSFGGASWTFTGAWTNSSTSASWSAGTGTVLFDSGVSQTMTFASLPGGVPEFANLTFDSGAATTTFTIAANALSWSTLLSVQGGTGVTTVASGGLGLLGGSLSIGNGGVLSAGASAVSVAAVAMTGGVSGSLTVTAGTWTVGGNWDTSGTGSSLSLGTSAVTLSGTGSTVNLAAGQAFYNLTVSGTVSLLSPLTASAALTIANAATLTKTGQSIAFNGLTEVGTGAIADGLLSVTGFSIANSDATNLTTINVFTNWSTDFEFTWTDTSTVGTSTLTFTIAGNTSGNRFNVLKDGVLFSSGVVDASGQVVFTMLGSDPVVDVQLANPCGGTRYWVGGAGNWSQTTHWSSSSGAPGGCSVPGAGMPVTFDANSGTGLATLDQNASISALTTSGWTGTLALGTFSLTIIGNLTQGSGTITIGASAASGLAVGGNLTLSGSAALDGSGSASIVSVAGNVSITSGTATIRMGSGTWTIGGSWSNGSTSASWAAGSGTIVFNSAVSQTMTFGNLPGSEFCNVVFSSSAPTGAIVFAMATNPLHWAGTLTIQDVSGSTSSLGTADLALTGGAVVIGNGGILVANASTVSVASLAMTGGTSGVLTLTTGSWIVNGNWDTSGAGSVFTEGTGSVTLAGTSSTVAILDAADGFSSLTVSGTVTAASALGLSGTLRITGSLTTAGNAITGGASLIVSGGGSFLATTSSVSVSSIAMNDTAANTISFSTGSLTVSGSWDTSGSASSFLPGSATVTLTGATGTIALASGQTFAALVVSGTYALASALRAVSLTVPSGGVAKGVNTLALSGDLLLSGGYLTSVSGAVSVSGNVDISAAASYIVFGTESWTVGGSWTNASSSGSWVAGTGTMTFNAATAQTMTFAGSHLSGNEFNAVVFNAGSGTVTFTLSGNGLAAQAITIQGGPGTTTLDTSASNFALATSTLTVAAGGALLANGSTITVGSMDTSAGSLTAGTSTIVVNASGGSIRVPQLLYSLTVGSGLTTAFPSNVTWSGALILAGTTDAFAGSLTSVGAASLTFASATLTVAGSWNTGSAVSFSSLSSSITFTGAGQTITLGPGQSFATLAIAGTIALASNLTAATLTVNASATLTMTGFSIAFNGLTVNGTVADASVNVTVLTVGNSDTTALITISSFTEWSAGSRYGWTHTSSESTQTITWTIGGNPAGHVFRVTKDGADYHDGTVDASGRVVFSMLGSDPTVEVVVSPPPIPPWWTSPFFIPLPFIASFVVVAMFVQRRRWRPAKAFLVDERGQLLREFTLDESCKVTYDQALQAGALDAVEKDIRVSKYHARAVHGDMLSLIMLAVGPANVEEVDFARGLLENVQDKLEDRTKARVEEARAEEQNLQAEAAQMEERRADLQTRARVFGDMVNAFTIARGKLDTQSRALQHQADDLVDREDAVAQVRESLEEQADRLEKLRVSLDETAAELEEQKKQIASTLASLDEREARISPKEESLAKREAAVTDKEKDLVDREDTLSAAGNKLTADLEEYHTKAQDLQRLQEELSEERRSLDDLRGRLDGRQTDLDARTVDVESREKEVASREEDVDSKIAAIGPREEAVAKRESDLTARETDLDLRKKTLDEEAERLSEVASGLKTQETALAGRARELSDERKALDEVTREAVEERKALDAKTASVQEKEAEVAKAMHDLDDLKANLGPREAALFGKESDLQGKEKALADERKAFETQQDLVAAKALEIQQQAEQLREREAANEQEKAVLREAKGAFDTERRDHEGRVAAFDEEVKRRRSDLEGQERTLGEARMRLTKDKQDFEAAMAEKSQWIASKEIELEAKEQSLADRETELRGQAEANGKNLAELAAREETLEIASAKADKERAELETTKAELGAMGRDIEARTAKLREEEARKGEELHTWQATLESEQALLKEQRETFEKEMLDLRESWAGRMIRVEQREEEFKEREAKVQADVEWVARNESEVGKREKLAAENLKSAANLKAEAERLRADLDQRALEVESRERTLQEEAASQAVELETRTESLQAAETELAGRRAQWESELATQKEKLRVRETELATQMEALDRKESDLAARETTLIAGQDALREQEERMARDRLDLQMTQERLGSGQLELTQAREKLEAESLRLRNETDAERQSLAAKEADLGSERERLERESAALQDTLGTKAKELAAREKGIAAREDELRSEEHDLESRVREIESRERQLDSRVGDAAAREAALAQSEEELRSRRGAFDEKVAKFEAEAANRQKEWKDLQATLKSQEQQLAASTETRHAEIRKRMEDLEQREHSLNAMQTQAQMERTRLEAQAKAQAARQAEVDAAAGRSDKRTADLQTMEDELLKTRQAFEADKANWVARRAEDLKQLEATRDAAAEQTQQAEKLIEESQRRVFVAAEAEKASKRQTAELATAQEALERRRVDAEKAEKALEAQTTQLREASERLAGKEVELGSRAKELDSLQARLAALEKKNAESGEQLKSRKESLDREAERVASLAAQLDKREAEDATRHSGLESKLAEVTKREQVLSTELQRADNLMEDLNRKESEIVAREKGYTSKETDLAAREAALARRDAEVLEGMRTLEKLKKEHEERVREVDEHHRVATQTRKEAEGVSAEAAKMKAQAEAMQAEVSKNMRFLQKKALDVLDREEKLRTRENRTDEEGRVLETRAQVLEKKERALEAERDELAAKLEKIKKDNESLKAKLADAERAGVSTVDVDEWKRDIENRVKIIQKKALDLLDREEKLRKKEEELRALAAQLGVDAPK